MEKGKLKGMFVSGNIPSGAEYKAALKDVLQAFPYFQLAQVLFAKQMYDTHEPEASSRIKLASVYAPDRKAMYILFKKHTDKPEEGMHHAGISESLKPQERTGVKYNFIYSSTTGEQVEVMHSNIKKEEETVQLSETFIREQSEIKPIIQTQPEEERKVAASTNQKSEEIKPETPKIQPFISVTPPVEKLIPVEEKKVEVKKSETPVVPPKKPYTTPTIEKKKSLYVKKTEPEVAKPLVTIKPPVEVKPPVIEKKAEEMKPLPQKEPEKKLYTPPVLAEKKKAEEKKVEPPVIKPLVSVKSPAETKPILTEKKPEEKKAEPVAASGRKPYTPPTIVWKRSLYTKKTEEKKPAQPPLQGTISAKPPIEITPPVIEKKEEIKIEKPVVQPPVIISPPAKILAPEIIQKAEEKKVEQPIIEQDKVEAPEVKIEEKNLLPQIPVISNEVVAPVISEPPVLEDKKIEVEEKISESATTEEIVLPNEPIADTHLKYSFSSWLKVIPEIGGEKKPEVKAISPAEASDLIDKFLQKEPSISRPKTEFFSPVKAAKMSITEDDTIVSETLAKIYFEQGSLPKALKAYQTLLHQFPEKKNIFAPRIEKIKVLIRENTK